MTCEKKGVLRESAPKKGVKKLAIGAYVSAPPPHANAASIMSMATHQL